MWVDISNVLFTLSSVQCQKEVIVLAENQKNLKSQIKMFQAKDTGLVSP